MQKNLVTLFATVKFNDFKILNFLMYTVFGTVVIILDFVFHLEGKIALRVGKGCNTVGYFWLVFVVFTKSFMLNCIIPSQNFSCYLFSCYAPVTISFY